MNKTLYDQIITAMTDCWSLLDSIGNPDYNRELQEIDKAIDLFAEWFDKQ